MHRCVGWHPTPLRERRRSHSVAAHCRRAGLMEELACARGSLDAVLAATRRELTQARDQSRAARRSRDAVWSFPARIEDTALVIYDLAGFVTEPAVHYLGGEAAKRRWPPKPAAALALLVESWFVRADVSRLAGLCDIAGPSDPSAMHVALSWVEQWRLATWARDLNSVKGVAPSTDAVLRQLETRRMALPAAVMPPPRGTSAVPRARMWALRWRRRWGGRHGTIRPRDDLPLDEMRRKVPRTFCEGSGSQNGTAWRSQNGTAMWGSLCLLTHRAIAVLFWDRLAPPILSSNYGTRFCICPRKNVTRPRRSPSGSGLTRAAPVWPRAGQSCA